MKKEISKIYPDFATSLTWEHSMVYNLVESVVKEPDMVWKSIMRHEIPSITGLFFVGDSTVSYGMGTDSAVPNSILCVSNIESYLKNR